MELIHLPVRLTEAPAMRLPRVRFTVQWMAVAVAAVAVALVAVQMLRSPPPPDARDWYAMGQVAFNAGKLPEARERFRRALELDPGAHQVYQGLAAVAGRSGDEQGEYDLTTRAIDVVQRDQPPGAGSYLARYYKGRAAAAVRRAGRLMGSSGRAPDPRVGRWYAAALRDVTAARGYAGEDDPRLCFAIEYVAASAALGLGDVADRGGDASGARAHYNEAERFLNVARPSGPERDLLVRLLAEVQSRSTSPAVVSHSRPVAVARLQAAPDVVLPPAGNPPAQPRDAVPPELVVQRFKIATGGDALLLPVRVGGKDHLFMLDTGCARTTFDRSLLLDKPRGAGRALALNGEIFEVAVYEPPDGSVGGLPLGVPEVAGMDLTASREVWGQPIEGILGMDFLGRHVLRLDFDRGELLFLRAAPEGAGVAVPIDWRPGDLPMVRARFGGMGESLFAIDTGFTGRDSGALRTFGVRDLMVNGDLSELGSVRTETAGGGYAARVFRGSRLTLGGFVVEGPIFKESPLFTLLGLGFWSRFTMTFDFPGRTAYLAEGRGYARPDLWNASGVRLRLRAGTVVVGSVDEGSPGARAALRAGDEVIELGDLRAGKAGLFALKGELCKRVRLPCVVRRGGEEHRVTVDLAE
jgi:tetratricopeptide (TPR) repeat protein